MRNLTTLASMLHCPVAKLGGVLIVWTELWRTSDGQLLGRATNVCGANVQVLERQLQDRLEGNRKGLNCCAHYEGVEILISGEEYLTLKNAGAREGSEEDRRQRREAFYAELWKTC